MSQEKYQQALGLFKAGEKEQANDLLLEVVLSDPGNAEAWFGLALCADSTERKKHSLQKVLEINPKHTKASQLLEKINVETFPNPYIEFSELKASAGKIIPSVMIGILVLCVGLLFYKVKMLEKSLVQTQSDLSITISSLMDTQSSLSSTINNLSYVEGLAVNANNFAHSHNNFSDGRLKKDITEINDPLNGILSLHGVNFSWDATSYPELGLNNDPQIGFIAQDVELIYPELVKLDESGFKTVDYPKLIPVLVEAIKEQQVMIVDLKQQIASIEKYK